MELFLINNPTILRETASDPNFKWMRTVSKEEASKCLKHLDNWLKQDVVSAPTKKKIHEWIYKDPLGHKNQDDVEEMGLKLMFKNHPPVKHKQAIELEELTRKTYEEEYDLKDISYS